MSPRYEIRRVLSYKYIFLNYLNKKGINDMIKVHKMKDLQSVNIPKNVQPYS